ncbi:TAXI family TRAP transporter solute-binding subunit [Pseudalkalibacillus sp. A8]|uniref:TAXI family TRAP transporter solute-binding subunit n=1 Tax=Pseudalkalibacillus sp. A8 TaxID=3382641 RepID=UPI0038B5C9FE
MYKLSERKISQVLIVLLLIVLLTACNSANGDNSKGEGSSSKDDGVITFGTTPVGGSINAVGNGLAKVISSNSDVKASVKPFNGLSAWGPMLNRGEIQLGIATQPELAWGYRGDKGFEEMKNIRLLVSGNNLKTPGFVVRKESEIETISDLKGKRVAAEYPGSASVVALLDAGLAINGLSWEDVKKVPAASTVDAIKALQDNNLDAAYALVPSTPVIAEVHNAVGLKPLNFLEGVSPDQIDQVSEDVKEQLSSHLPGAKVTVIEPSGYISKETTGVQYALQLVGTTHLSEETVYEIMETLWEKYEELHPIHVWFKQWTPEAMFDPEPTIPYHPGAIQFYKDKGLWNDKVEKIQQELLE